MDIRLIHISNEAYQQMRALRWRVLLEPIGVPQSYMDEERESNEMLVAAFEEGVLIGCCILTHINDELLQLRQMAVEGSNQRLGIGRAIVAYAEKLASKKGYQTVMMHARDTVIYFYEKCGYVIADDGFTEVGIPHYRMEKRLQ